MLNLADNSITQVPTLIGQEKLTDLNLKNNMVDNSLIFQINVFHKNVHLISLQRLRLNENKIKKYEAFETICYLPNLIDLSLENNKIADDPNFRAIVIGKCKCLKILNSRRILEEEKRLAAKFVKKDIERYKIN